MATLVGGCIGCSPLTSNIIDGAVAALDMYGKVDSKHFLPRMTPICYRFCVT
jgi:hypothetical protein